MECEMLCKNPPFASVSRSTSALSSSQHHRLWIASLGSRNDGNGCCRLSMARLLRIVAMNRNGANAWWRWITLIAELAMHSVTATCTKPCNAHREAFWRGKGWATISAELNGVAVQPSFVSVQYTKSKSVLTLSSHSFAQHAVCDSFCTLNHPGLSLLQIKFYSMGIAFLCLFFFLHCEQFVSCLCSLLKMYTERAEINCWNLTSIPYGVQLVRFLHHANSHARRVSMCIIGWF